MEKIVIRSKDMVETKEVDAKIYGKLAVHQAWLSHDGLSDLLTVTHIPTGANLPVLSEARKAVESCARELSRVVDWDFSDLGGAQGLKSIVVPIIEDWGVHPNQFDLN